LLRSHRSSANGPLKDPWIELNDNLRRDETNRRAYHRKFMTTAVLVIDELGFQALDRRDAHHLFRVISYRYEKVATIITSNKSISQWPGMLAVDDVGHRHPRPPAPPLPRRHNRQPIFRLECIEAR
jgi:hypothetical protein